MSHFGMTNKRKEIMAIKKTEKTRQISKDIFQNEKQRNTKFVSRNLHMRYVKYSGLLKIATVAMLTGDTIITTDL